MTRIVKNWTPVKVDASLAAPHRYLWSGTINEAGEQIADTQDADDHKAARALIPYKVGDIVYVQYGNEAVLALIKYAGIERNHHGDFRAFFNVQRATKAGHFSKVWYRTYPGLIQRGYQLAGLAPEMPKE